MLFFITLVIRTENYFLTISKFAVPASQTLTVEIGVKCTWSVTLDFVSVLKIGLILMATLLTAANVRRLEVT